MSMRTRFLFLGAELALMMSSAVIFAVWSENWALMAGALVVTAWLGRFAALGVAPALWPLRYPRLSTLAKPGWRLRRRPVELAASELRELGFVEIGVKCERAVRATPSREFWHPGRRTFASLFVGPFFAPVVSFLSAGEDGRIVYSGAGVKVRRRTVTARVAVGSSTAERFQDHLRALKNEELVAAAFPTEPRGYRGEKILSHEQLLKWRLELSREWYVVVFGTNQQWRRWSRARKHSRVRVGELADSEPDEIEVPTHASEEGRVG